MKLAYFLEDAYNKKLDKKAIQKRYNIDLIFRKYVDMAYAPPCERKIKRFPKFRPDPAPVGLNPASIVQNITKFEKALFAEDLDEGKRIRMLVQILESVSEPEARFLKEVFYGKTSLITKKAWEKLNAAV